jgi:hypothetical protein
MANKVQKIRKIVSGNLPGFDGLAGGIGNQLFLIATMLSVAWDNDADVLLRFDAKHKYRYQNDYSHNLLKQFTFTEGDLVYSTVQQADMPDKLTIQTNTIVEGYFQSPVYFSRYTDRIRNTFNITESVPEVVQAVSALRLRYPDKKIVSIQVRRGDYQSLGWTLQTHYYKNAMAKMTDTAFVISTDDREWCGKIFPDIEILNYPDWIEFLVLCNLDGIIMSNSTFGWWVAFLGNLQLVVAPDPWFKNNSYDQNLYLPHWQRLEW